jgi:hypothetical protein
MFILFEKPLDLALMHLVHQNMMFDSTYATS